MSSKTLVACLIAWLVPGGGHLYLNRWKRGTVFLLTVLVLFALGLWMQGQLFSLVPSFFGVLKFFAGASTGILYVSGKMAGLGTGEITAFSYEYGNTFLYTAGLLNMLMIVDAFDIAEGRKQ
jgi:hypothetical protein